VAEPELDEAPEISMPVAFRLFKTKYDCDFTELRQVTNSAAA
jgi:hypothetical protein